MPKQLPHLKVQTCPCIAVLLPENNFAKLHLQTPPETPNKLLTLWYRMTNSRTRYHRVMFVLWTTEAQGNGVTYITSRSQGLKECDSTCTLSMHK